MKKLSSAPWPSSIRNVFMHYYLICPSTKTKCLVGMGDEHQLRVIWSENSEVVGNMTKFWQMNAGQNVRLVTAEHKSLAKFEQVLYREPTTRAKLHMSGKIGRG